MIQSENEVEYAWRIIEPVCLRLSKGFTTNCPSDSICWTRHPQPGIHTYLPDWAGQYPWHYATLRYGMASIDLFITWLRLVEK